MGLRGLSGQDKGAILIAVGLPALVLAGFAVTWILQEHPGRDVDIVNDSDVPIDLLCDWHGETTTYTSPRTGKTYVTTPRKEFFAYGVAPGAIVHTVVADDELAWGEQRRIFHCVAHTAGQPDGTLAEDDLPVTFSDRDNACEYVWNTCTSIRFTGASGAYALAAHDG